MVGGFPRKEGMERKEARPPRERVSRRCNAAGATTAVARALRALTRSAPPAQVMGKNVSIYKSQASALEKFAAKDVKARREDHAMRLLLPCALVGV